MKKRGETPDIERRLQTGLDRIEAAAICGIGLDTLSNIALRTIRDEVAVMRLFLSLYGLDGPRALPGDES